MSPNFCVHPEPLNVTSFGNGIFADTIKLRWRYLKVSPKFPVLKTEPPCGSVDRWGFEEATGSWGLWSMNELTHSWINELPWKGNWWFNKKGKGDLNWHISWVSSVTMGRPELPRWLQRQSLPARRLLPTAAPGAWTPQPL